jgi:hypothetical protein
MDNIAFVQELKPAQRLVQNVLAYVFRVRLICRSHNHIGDAPVHQFDNDPKPCLVVEDSFTAEDGVSLIEKHDTNLIDHLFFLLSILISHQLHGEMLLVM